MELSEALRETEAFLKASRLVKEAGISEEEGDISTSIRKHQAALRAFPDIETWYNVIF